MESQTSLPVAPSAKVFVGNLSFRTTDQDLQVLFKDCGEIKAGVVVTRGRRSLGYGFIEFGKLDDAARSVDTMNGKEFMGRALKVELAKDPNDRPSFERTPPEPKQNRKPAENPIPQPPRNPQAINLQPPQQPQEAGPAKRRRNNRRRRGGNTGAPQDPSQPVLPTQPQQLRPPRQPRQPNPPAAPIQNPGDAPKQLKPPKQPRQPRNPPREKVMSKTTLFVANLPFSVDEALLISLFGGFNVKSAHIVRTRSGRSRGYGFVVFENEADQLKALEAKNGTEVTGSGGEPRKLNVSISSSVPPDPTAPAQTPTVAQTQVAPAPVQPAGTQ
jgi:RNA recognition motif-containing protein